MQTPSACLDDAIRMTRDDVLADPELSRFQKVLLLSDGSVTELLCIYTGRDITTTRLEQTVKAGEAPDFLGVDADTPLLRRRILLTETQASVHQVYAESVFVHERLSPLARRLLLESDLPIGRLWKQEKTEMYRDIVDIRIERDPRVAYHFDEPADVPLLSRTYLLRQGARPMGAITEKFPLSRFRA